ncbi:MAG: histidinol dehydrogenase [Phycisphaeraceae bacterium]|nr:histidinol dehydrogenase [Phycisphaeraceae bacterium]
MFELHRFDLATEAGLNQYRRRLTRLRQTVSLTGEAVEVVRQVIDQVRLRGDEALVEYMRKWTDPEFAANRIVVDRALVRRATDELDTELRSALETAIDHVRKYQQHLMPDDPAPMKLDGAVLGLRHTPVDSCGLLVPGGTAVLFSTLVMTAVPALVAGVTPAALHVVNPPPTRGAGMEARDISPIVLGTCGLLGLDQVYRIGGAQAVAALAYGTVSVPKVDLVVGPGNSFVQLAKAQLQGTIGTEGGFYGPSEIVTVADESANPDWVAADLLAQAEHNPGKCFLVTWLPEVIEKVSASVTRQGATLPRAEAVAAALAEDSCAVKVADEEEAARIVNELAPEHLNLAVRDPKQWLKVVRHAGEVFMGDGSPVASGDYLAGPSHCLPTGTTARFAGGLSVFSFLKRTGLIGYPQGMSKSARRAVALLARAEGLEAHARSVEIRGRG